MSTKSQIIWNDVPRITNTPKFDKCLQDILDLAREHRKTKFQKLVDKLKRL